MKLAIVAWYFTLYWHDSYVLVGPYQTREACETVEQVATWNGYETETCTMLATEQTNVMYLE